MSKSLKEEILELIEISRNNYAGMPARITADYDTEKGLVKAYNGRQVLEMLQNADDAGAARVEIRLDIQKRTLRISNTGTPFNKDGIQSLMLAGASKKTKKSYIGNKGLGFRSILNWAELVEIDTNGCVVSFSHQLAKSAYLALPLTASQWQEHHSGSKYRENTIPFAILAIPNVRDADDREQPWSTAITITYRPDFEASIIKQLQLVGEECLLFLNNICHLDIIGLPEGGKHFKKNSRSASRAEEVTINDRHWQVYKLEGMYEEGKNRGDQEEDEYYSIKVAVNESLSDNIGVLFSFFPTLVSFPLPCVVHATFELDPSRNAIVDIEKNVFLFEELGKLLISIAEDIASTNQKWNAYRLLTPTNENSDNPQVRGFYQRLKTSRDQACIFPTINGQMRLISQVRFYGDNFAEFVQSLETDHFGELLLPLDTGISPVLFSGRKYSDYELQYRINLINPNLTIKHRAKLIHFLSGFDFNSHKQKYALLVNEQGNIIPASVPCYTPILTRGVEYDLPNFLEIEFMSMTLYQQLIYLYAKNGVPVLPRELQNEVKNVVNLQPYDSNQVTERIISRANSLVQNGSKDQNISVVREMVRALWSNFKSSPKYGTYGAAVPLLNLSLGVTESVKLLYSESYPKGPLTKDIYGDSLPEYQYLAPIDQYELKALHGEPLDLYLVEDFFRWTGVNALTIIEVMESEISSQDDYYGYIENNQPGFRSGSRLKVNDFQIKDFNHIQKKMSLEQLILWAIKCERIQQALKLNVKEVMATKNNKTEKYRELRSYIHHRFIHCGKICNYIIEDHGIPAVNPRMINYQSELFHRYGITKPDIDSTLLKLGAVESFGGLSADRVFELLSQCKFVDPNGKYAQKLYKLALRWFESFKGQLPNRPHISYFAKKGDQKGYDLGKVYYSDNQALPDHILKDFAILDLPKRAGEDKVAKLFLVNNFKDIPIAIIPESIIQHPLDEIFQQYWLKIRDMVLAYRIENLNTQADRKAASNQIKQFSVNLISKGDFYFDGASVAMEPQGMINIGNQFYVRTELHIKELTNLKDSPEFCDTLAESLCILFKVTEQKNDFRRLFKNDVADSRHLISQDLGEGTWSEAKALLGASNVEQNFWKKVFALMNLQVDLQTSTDGISNSFLFSLLGEDFGYFPSMLDNLADEDTYNFLYKLCGRFGFDPRLLLADLYASDGFRSIHLQRILLIVRNYRAQARRALWKKLSKASLPEKMRYKQLLDEYTYGIRERLVPFVQAYDFSFEVPYEHIATTAIQQLFSIESLEGVDESEPINQYPDLFSEIANHSYSSELLSLFYFENLEEEIRSRIPATEKQENVMREDVNQEQYIVELLQGTDFSAVPFPGIFKNGANERSWIANANVDNAKREAGKRSEETVFKYLVKLYGMDNVDWRSGNSHVIDRDDNLHYDIEYRNKDGVWKMLEVKTLAGNTFIISRKEVEKGCEHWRDYEIALVSNNRIDIVKNFFEGCDPSRFDSNRHFSVTPKDYYVSFNKTALS